MKKLILLVLVFVVLSCGKRRHDPNGEKAKRTTETIMYDKNINNVGSEIEVVEKRAVGAIGVFAIIKIDNERFLVNSDGFMLPLKKTSE